MNSAMQTEQQYVSSRFPFLDGLKQMGMHAQLVGGRLNIGPSHLITDNIIRIARENRESILAELKEIQLARAESEAESFQVCPPDSRYSDESHDLDEAYIAWVICYELASELYNQLGQDDSKPCCWNGDPNRIPPVPFYWVKDVRLDNPSQTNDYGKPLKVPTAHTNSYQYLVMFRDVNNVDSVIVEDSTRDKLIKRGRLQMPVTTDRGFGGNK